MLPKESGSLENEWISYPALLHISQKPFHLVILASFLIRDDGIAVRTRREEQFSAEFSTNGRQIEGLQTFQFRIDSGAGARGKEGGAGGWHGDCPLAIAVFPSEIESGAWNEANESIGGPFIVGDCVLETGPGIDVAVHKDEQVPEDQGDDEGFHGWTS